MMIPDEMASGESVLARLLRAILEMSPEQQSNLLRQVEERAATTLVDPDRQDVRKPYKATIEFYAKDKTYQGFSKDISSSGMFILTGQMFSVGQIVSLKISFSNSERHIRVPAQIVRATDDGIGVEFLKKTDA